MAEAGRQAAVQGAEEEARRLAEMALRKLEKLSFNELASVAMELWPTVTGYVFKIGRNIGKIPIPKMHGGSLSGSSNSGSGVENIGY